MKQLPRITATRDRLGRVWTWVQTTANGPKVRFAKWWADVIVRQRMAKDFR